MRSIVKTRGGPEGVEILDLPDPTVEAGDVLIRVAFCGICGTDLKIWRDKHDYYVPPMTLGHEFSGTIVAVGEGVDSLAPGDRVTALPAVGWSGPGGPRQRRGSSHPSGVITYGGFSDLLIARADSTYLIPDDLPLEHAAFMEPLAVVVRALHRSNSVRAGDRVVVTGPGPIGLLALLLAKAQGAHVAVVGISQDEQRLALAETCGADLALCADLAGAEDALAEWLGEGADVAVECAASSAAIANCIRWLRPGGTLVQVGTSNMTATVPFTQIAYKELKVHGSFAHDDSERRRAVDLLAERVIDPSPLITSILPLDRWREAFEMLESASGAKVLLTPSMAAEA